VHPDPLDQLGVIEPGAGDPKFVHTPTLEEIAIDAADPRYGWSYLFVIRKLGLTGLGPKLQHDAGILPKTPPGYSRIDRFLRTVPVAAPACLIKSNELEKVVRAGAAPQGDDGCDGTYLIKKSNAQFEISTPLPLAHWRVALHAKGFGDAESQIKGVSGFEDACLNFAKRASVTLGAAAKNEEHIFLTAVDPHVAGIELASRVWFPFSTVPIQAEDRYVVTGKTTIDTDFPEKSSFAELVIAADDIIENRTRPINLTASPRKENGMTGITNDHPTLYPGFRNRLECYGLWNPNEKHITRWGNPDLYSRDPWLEPHAAGARGHQYLEHEYRTHAK